MRVTRSGFRPLRECLSKSWHAQIHARASEVWQPPSMDSGLSWLGILSLGATALIAYYVYRLQKKEGESRDERDGAWKGAIRQAVEDLGEIVRQVAEQLAAAEEERIVAEAATETADEGADTSVLDRPRNVDDYLEALRSASVSIDASKAVWKKKARSSGERRGNLGWFVEDGREKRYFIHRGRTTTVRPAIPRSMLEAWEKKTKRDPKEIELDYQTGAGRGNHAWFVRTYDGKTWRISRGGQGKIGPTVTELES